MRSNASFNTPEYESDKPEDLVTVSPFKAIRDKKAPPSPTEAIIGEHAPRHADEIFQRVSTANPAESSRGIAIPARAYGAEASSSSAGAIFVELARENVNRTEAHADPVSFQQYWPTYAAMDERQLRWYFYWRTQLRQGNWLPTDLSYLFVHVYEVINMVGFDNPKDAFKYLVHFWQYYRKSQSKLDRYLPDWIADFIVVHKLAPDASNWYKETAAIPHLKDQDYVIDAWVNSGGDLAELPITDVFKLANYNPWESNFYRFYAKVANLDQAYFTGLAEVDAAIREDSGKSLFQFYRSKKLHFLQRAPFERAVHAYPRSAIKIFPIPSWTNNRPLSRMLKNVLKFTEITVCRQSGHRCKQQNIQLKTSWKTLIESALRTKASIRKARIDFAEKPKSATKSRRTLRGKKSRTPKRETVVESVVKPEAPKQELSIDMSQVKQLSIASEALRARLLADEDTDLEQRKPQEPPTDQREPLTTPADDSVPVDRAGMVSASANGSDTAAGRIVSGYLRRPENMPEGSLTDLAEVAQVIGGSGSKVSKLIAVLMNNRWACPVDAIQSAFPGEFINVIVDEINSNALEEIGDNLILEEDGLLVILEDYRDEIEYILQHPEYRKAESVS